MSTRRSSTSRSAAPARPPRPTDPVSVDAMVDPMRAARFRHQYETRTAFTAPRGQGVRSPKSAEVTPKHEIMTATEVAPTSEFR